MDGRLPDCGSQLPGFVIYFLFQIFCSLWLRTTRPTIGKIFSIARCSPAMEAADISWSQGDKNISWDHGDIKIYFETKKMTWPTCVSFHDMDQISYALLDYHLNQLGSWESPKCTTPRASLPGKGLTSRSSQDSSSQSRSTLVFTPYKMVWNS